MILRTIRLCLLAAAAASLLLVLPAPVRAKSFHFARVEITADVRPDGSLRMAERRTYRFSGDFRWATRQLVLRGAGDVREIQVADERGPYRPATSEEPGTYQVTRRPGEAVVKWFYRARDEERTFTISYILTDVVTVYSDVAEVFWRFVGPEWDVPSDDVLVTVRLPRGVRREEIRAWGHGPLHGAATIEEATVLLAVRGLPAFTMVEGRVAFPPRAVPGATKRQNRAALETIIAEETALADQANRERGKARAVVAGWIAYPLLLAGLFLFLYLRYGREYEPAVADEYYRDLPGEYPPAELGALWRFRRVRPEDFVATVMDLARRGYLKIEEHEAGLDDEYVLVPTKYRPEAAPAGGWRVAFRKRLGRVAGLKARAIEEALDVVDDVVEEELEDAAGEGGSTGEAVSELGLRPYERRALEILFGRSGRRLRVSPKEGLQGGAKTRLQYGFAKWTKLVNEAAKRHRWFDETSFRLRTAVRIGGIVLAATSFLAMFSFSIAAPRLAILVLEGIPLGILVSIFAFAIDRRSQRGADEFRRWRGFQRFLRDFSQMKDQPVPALTVWEHYLVYAIPLGVADRVLRQLRALYPAAELQRSGMMTWYTPSSGWGHGDGAGLVDSFRSFTSTFTSTVSTAASPPSSGGGGGGGFSGGGGGGGRGGGGGGGGGSAG